ncbi:MAG: preprotein translocase subunit SecE [Burkholderiaceae bacterium]|nr:MAG: preprotein translocase subunit SecE [Burkholderiaceae bacterium]
MANQDVQTVGSAADKIKVALALALLLAGLVGFYQLSSQPMVLRVVSVLAGFVLALGMASLSEPGRRFIAFFKEATLEARRVVWPTRKETLQMTGIVFGFVVIMALFLWLTDKSLEWVLYDLILGWKK